MAVMSGKSMMSVESVWYKKQITACYVRESDIYVNTSSNDGIRSETTQVWWHFPGLLDYLSVSISVLTRR